MSESEASTEVPIHGEYRPHLNLLVYYFLTSLLFGPFFFIPLIPRLARFRTLRYEFDEEGVSMQWGILFRREISLNYPRIQDIHLTSNFVERWLGLARLQLQTAAGSATAEMTVEGLEELEQIRDFLYSRMRGRRREGRHRAGAAPGDPRSGEAAGELGHELAGVLREVTAELRAVRQALETRGGPPGAAAGEVGEGP
ncbi:MAG: PH domain-containing protein [Acidobacteriota bacterium]|nr:PH domain-containing protein [Acidobacteriota bacterium]